MRSETVRGPSSVMVCGLRAGKRKDSLRSSSCFHTHCQQAVGWQTQEDASLALRSCLMASLSPCGEQRLPASILNPPPPSNGSRPRIHFNLSPRILQKTEWLHGPLIPHPPQRGSIPTDVSLASPITTITAGDGIIS